MSLRFDIKRINVLKDILLLLNNGASSESIQTDVANFFKDENVIDILLLEHELLNKDYGITIADLMELSSIHPHLYSNSLSEEIIVQTSYPGHPVQILKEENIGFQSILNQIDRLFETFEKYSQESKKMEIMDEAKQQIFRLGEFNNHFNRKEKLFFPMMERHGYFGPAAIMWRGDDRIRALYKALKGQTSQYPDLDFNHIKKTYDTFEKEFREMIFQEEAIILPVLQSIFHESDWVRIADESDAFGYALMEPEKEWFSRSKEEMLVTDKERAINKTKATISSNENIPFGGGYLTIEEANLILNNLPLEITFVDRNSVFKYFNKITEASEMMLVRTPLSIGRNVSNCHPPKSLSKVMTLVRDLKAKRRTTESMWFKMKGQYIHLTYKPLFNEQDEFLGILEYVQDIQPFFELPSEIKRGLSKIEK